MGSHCLLNQTKNLDTYEKIWRIGPWISSMISMIKMQLSTKSKRGSVISNNSHWKPQHQDVGNKIIYLRLITKHYLSSALSQVFEMKKQISQIYNRNDTTQYSFEDAHTFYAVVSKGYPQVSSACINIDMPATQRKERQRNLRNSTQQIKEKRLKSSAFPVLLKSIQPKTESYQSKNT